MNGWCFVNQETIQKLFHGAFKPYVFVSVKPIASPKKKQQSIFAKMLYD